MRVRIKIVISILIITLVSALIIWLGYSIFNRSNYKGDPDPKTIPIVIISWNGLTFVRNFVDQLLRYPNPIIILDNHSTYPDLLHYYDYIENELGDRVTVKRLLENYGHTVYLKRKDLLPQLYILSDPDLQLNPKMPNNMAEILLSISNKHRVHKVGLALDISDSDKFKYIPGYGTKTMELGGEVREPEHITIEQWERQFWNKPIKDPNYELYKADIDTTFCLVNWRFNNGRESIRVAGNFTCKHLPWYKDFIEDNIPKEELSYLQKNNKSSTVILSEMQDKSLSRNDKLTKSNKMLKYVIYFPQFHNIEENNVNFYPGYTDIVNLRDLKVPNKETPSSKHLPLRSVEDYDLSRNTGLIQAQINLVKMYNIDGFATYHYWFSDNSVTGDKMIMENINRRLLSSDLGSKRIFYIWANEDWTNNYHLGGGKSNISNSYTAADQVEHSEYLLRVFKEPGYLKIDNKPVFFIHHPGQMKDVLHDFHVLLDTECRKNGFDGVFLSISSHGTDKKVVQEGGTHYYDHHPHYKNRDSWAVKIPNSPFNFDYARYVDMIEMNSDIQTIFFDFDNRARLNSGNHSRLSTVCFNNTEAQFKRYFEKIKERSPKILLINAWNEWGEKMHVEPSNRKGAYYLELINKHMTKI